MQAQCRQSSVMFDDGFTSSICHARCQHRIEGVAHWGFWMSFDPKVCCLQLSALLLSQPWLLSDVCWQQHPVAQPARNHNVMHHRLKQSAPSLPSHSSLWSDARFTLGSALVFPVTIMPETATVMPKPLHHGQQICTSFTQATQRSVKDRIKMA